MNKFLLIVFSLIISCKNNNITQNGNANDSITSMVSSNQQDSTKLKVAANMLDSVIAKRNTRSIYNGSDLKTEDYIVQCPNGQKSSLISHIEYVRKEWRNVPSPITATYEGNDFGDYFHVIFKDANGVTYDFGKANNNYGEYKLYELSGQYEDNPKYLGKKFTLYWDWVLSEFYCCDGEYDMAKAYLPSITKLELIKK